MNKKKLLTFLVIIYFGIFNCVAQQLPISSGGDLSSASGSISYSIGQVVYNTDSGAEGSIAQGNQQPYEISEVLSSGNFTLLSSSLNVYPNPSTDILILTLRNDENISLNYQLIDLNGKVLKRNLITSNETRIVVDILPSSIYFLKIMNENTEVKTLKIIKN